MVDGSRDRPQCLMVQCSMVAGVPQRHPT